MRYTADYPTLSHNTTQHIISASLPINVVSVSAIVTDLSPKMSVCLSVCLSGKCTVTKRLIGS